MNFIPGGLSNDNSFSSASDDVFSNVGGQVFQAHNTFPTSAAVQDQAAQNVFQQAPSFLGGPIVPVRNPAPAFTGQSGVIALPSQQGPAFIGGQGGSFVGGQAFGQGVSGSSFQQGGAQPGGFQVPGIGFPSRVIQQDVTPTVTRTVTIDAYETLTDLVLHSVAVTVTQFSLVTTTRATTVVSAYCRFSVQSIPIIIVSSNKHWSTTCLGWLYEFSYLVPLVEC